MKFRKPTIGALLVVVIGAMCFLAATSRGMLVMQSLIGFSKTFSVGQANLSKGDSWLLLDYRERSGDPHMKLGLVASRENADLPEGRYYSFEDIERSGHVTFIEIEDDAVARVGRVDSGGRDCHRIDGSAGRRLVQCRPDKQQTLVYDLDRSFVAVVSPAEGQLLEHVLAVVAK